MDRRYTPTHDDILALAENITSSSLQHVVNRRKELLKDINGELFCQLQKWPKDMKLAFFKKPMTDQDTFKLLCFMLGNGCQPSIICEWVLSSQKWATNCSAKSRTRAYQLSWFLQHIDSNEHRWFYYDILKNHQMYLNGRPRLIPKFTFKRKRWCNI